ncbi:MAG TPA: histidine--tRNA ligase [Limnochordales bacterium]
MLKAPRGTQDVLPDDAARWHQVEQVARSVFAAYGYREIRTPILEHTELFARGVGEHTDVVEKEMYTFEDRSGRSITLRPEGTAPVARAYIEHGMHLWPAPVKLFYIGPMFRYERPQAGRLRQHHQMGAEALGSDDPALDAEAILLPMDIFRRLGLEQFTVKLNSIGCPSCRPAYRQALLEFLRPHAHELCPHCQRRLERSPLRVLDCKVPGCQELVRQAPPSVEFLCEGCRRHFQAVQDHLRALGVAYQHDSRLVRGFDYYTRTVFEVQAPQLGAQNAVAGGGRYDGLVEALGGPPTPGVGFASGIERALLAWSQAGQASLQPGRPGEQGWLDVYVAAADGPLAGDWVQMVYRLRRSGVRTEAGPLGKSLKSQLRAADRAGARWVVLVGDAPWPAAVRDMRTGEQQPVSGPDEAAAWLLNQMGRA